MSRPDKMLPPIKNSIATQLLKAVFLYYVVVTVVVTAAQMYAEVQQARAEADHDLEVIAETFAPSLARALWDTNFDQLRPIVRGMLKLQSVVGVRVIDDQDRVVAVSGIIGTDGEEPASAGIETASDEFHALTGFFHFDFPIVYKAWDRDVQVGKGTLFSSNSVVIDKVKLGFMLLAVNAMIKTVALWVLFLWISHIMLRRPLAFLTAATRRVDLDRLEEIDIRVKSSCRNELVLLEETFNIMISQLRRSKDVIEAKSAALDRTSERMQGLLDNTPALVSIKDLEGKYLLVNRKFEQSFGLSNETVSNRTDHDLFAASVAADLSANDRRVLEQRRPLEFEEVLPQADGHRTYLAIKFLLFDNQGQLDAVCTIATDITERKKAEAVLKDYSQRLEETVTARTRDLNRAKNVAETANKAKSEFLANMSHEIRTPLNPIIGLTHLALQFEADPRVRDYMTKIQQSSRSLLGIVNDILDFSKIEAGRMSLERTPFSLDRVLQTLESIFGARAAEKGLGFSIVGPVGLFGHLVGDPLRLEQVLSNLISNALKFTKKGSVRVSVQVDQQTKDAAMLTFEVADTGIGISAEESVNLFQPFTQADGSTTRKFGGTGLGLSICQSLVTLMDGEITVDSTQGQGSRFRFRIEFPLSKQANLPDTPNVATAKASLQEMSDRRILLAEDNPLNQLVARDLLETAGLSVSVARSGREVLEYLEREPFDLVLMDIQMPEMDGYEATRRIRKDPRFLDMPIIAMTAHALASDRDKCLKMGMNDHIAKPIDPKQLFDKLGQWLPLDEEMMQTEPEPPEQPLSLPGFNLKQGLAHVRGNWTLLVRLLDEFVKNYSQAAAILQGYMNDGETQKARQLAHNLNGIAGTLC